MGTAIYPLFDSSGNSIPPPTVDVTSGSDSSGADTSGWLSGLGDLFAGVGTAVSSGLKAANTPNVPSASGWVFNPATGQYYNAITGQALTSTGTLPSAGIFSGGSSNTIVLIIIAIAAFFLLKKAA